MLRKLTRIRKLNPRRKGIRIFLMGGNSLTCRNLSCCASLKRSLKRGMFFTIKA
jgi:hypothetical protein